MSFTYYEEEQPQPTLWERTKPYLWDASKPGVIWERAKKVAKRFGKALKSLLRWGANSGKFRLVRFLILVMLLLLVLWGVWALSLLALGLLFGWLPPKERYPRRVGLVSGAILAAWVAGFVYFDSWTTVVLGSWPAFVAGFLTTFTVFSIIGEKVERDDSLFSEWATDLGKVERILLPDGERYSDRHIILGDWETPGRLPGRPDRTVVAKPGEHHVILLGASRSGKTSRIYIPNLLQEMGANFVVCSIRNDILDQTINYRRTQGPVTAYDPEGLAERQVVSSVWSIVQAARTYADAQRIVETIVGAQAPDKGGEESAFFSAQVRNTLPGLLLAANLGGYSLRDVIAWVNRSDVDEAGANQGKPFTKAIAILQEEGEAEAATPLIGLGSMEERTRENVVASISAALQPYQKPGVLNLADGDDSLVFDPHEFVRSKEPWTHYLIASVNGQKDLGKVFANHIVEILDAAMAAANDNGGRLEKPLIFLLDEAANLAPIPDLDAWVTTAAGANVMFVLGYHNLSQMQHRIKGDASTVWANCHARLVFHSTADPETIRLLETLGGHREVEITNVSFDDVEKQVGSSEGRTLVPLIGAKTVREQEEGRAILLLGNLPPIKDLKLRAWYEDPTFSARSLMVEPEDTPDAIGAPENSQSASEGPRAVGSALSTLRASLGASPSVETELATLDLGAPMPDGDSADEGWDDDLPDLPEFPEFDDDLPE